jgi:hypothetical protein
MERSFLTRKMRPRRGRVRRKDLTRKMKMKITRKISYVSISLPRDAITLADPSSFSRSLSSHL